MYKKVQTFFFVIMIFAKTLLAASYDDTIISMYAKLSPRIVLMSSEKDTIEDKSIDICLLYQSIDEQAATTLQRKINDNYKNGIKEYEINAKKVLYTKLDECAKSKILFLFASESLQLQKSIEFSREKKILTISYDSKNLEQGADISLFIGRKVLPYININSIKNKGIDIDNLLLRISKIYIKEREGEKK